MVKIERIDRDPRYAELAAELTKLEQRLAETRKRRERALAIRRGAKSGRTAVERASDLVKGAFVPALDPDKELLACAEEEAILVNGIREKAAELDAVAGDLSVALARRLQAEHTGYLRDAVAAIAAMTKAFSAAAELRAKVRDAGYMPVPSILPDTMPPAALALGQNGLQLSMWKDFVELHSGIKL